MTNKRKDCPMRHENGNCTVAGGFCTAVNDPVCEDLHNAFNCGYRSAIRQQETVANRNGLNEPLTLNELREMLCEPVYIVAGYVSWWDIVSFAGTEYLYLKVEGSLPFRDYGKNWTSYRQKPEEETL